MNIGLGFFSLNKVYDKVRPDYDYESISKVLKDEFASDTKLTGAEIGAGSGKFTSILFKSLNFESLYHIFWNNSISRPPEALEECSYILLKICKKM